MRKHNKSILMISIILTIIVGFIIGVISTSQLRRENYQLSYQDIPYLQVFLNSFSFIIIPPDKYNFDLFLIITYN